MEILTEYLQLEQHKNNQKIIAANSTSESVWAVDPIECSFDILLSLTKVFSLSRSTDRVHEPTHSKDFDFKISNRSVWPTTIEFTCDNVLVRAMRVRNTYMNDRE